MNFCETLYCMKQWITIRENPSHYSVQLFLGFACPPSRKPFLQRATHWSNTDSKIAYIVRKAKQYALVKHRYAFKKREYFLIQQNEAYLNRLRTTFKCRKRPVPVVFRRWAFILQLSIHKSNCAIRFEGTLIWVTWRKAFFSRVMIYAVQNRPFVGRGLHLGPYCILLFWKEIKSILHQ